MNQRWNNHRDSYRPDGEPINTTLYEVAEIDRDSPAKSFVLAHHYAGTYPAARFRFGLYGARGLEGVAVFSVPCNFATLTNVFPCPASEATELGRFVLLNSVAGNGETWFLARCFDLLKREGIAGVVSFSDPVQRTSVSGDAVFGGHIGTIYQAHNAVYLGRGTARTLRLLPDGSVLSDRAIQKLRSHDRGWQYVAELLVRFGADRTAASDPGQVSRIVREVTRPLKHPGNHKYAWGLSKSIRRHLPKSEDYPKLRAA